MELDGENWRYRFTHAVFLGCGMPVLDVDIQYRTREW